MKNLLNKKLCVTAVATFLLVFGSSFSYGNNVKQKFCTFALTFEVLDLNNDGYLTGDELDGLLDPIYTGTLPNAALNIILKIIDSDKDGRVSPEEFAGYGQKLPYLTMLLSWIP